MDYRAKLGELMRATVADEQKHRDWHYHAVRPCPVPSAWKPGQVVSGDCSKGVQFLAKWAGVPHDPMDGSYGVYGNSQTLWLKLQHLDRASDLKVGDVVTFGRDGNEHAAMVAEAGADPLLWSFGHEGAPNFYRLSQDRRERQFLRLKVPDYVPTPQDRLRSRTGWFAWMAWRLGEGDWSGYGKANPKVRPAVPKVIPPTWWTRYAKFIANRNKPNQ